MLCLCRFFTAPAMEVENKNHDIKFSFAAEVYTNISAANIFISCGSGGGGGGELSSMTVKLHKDFLIVQVSKEDNVVHQMKVKAPPNFFIPISFYSDCPSLSLLDEVESGLLVANYINGNLNEPSPDNMAVSFRVQVNASVSESDIDATKMTSLKEPRSEVSYALHCMQCKSALRDGFISFKKVAPVLGNANEISEVFFCHKHENQQPVAAQKEDELLYTPNYYRVVCLQNDRLSQESASRNVHCANCHSFLGTKPRKQVGLDRDVIYCFKDKVVFREAESELSFWPSGSDASLAILLDIIEQTLASSLTCKLVLEAKATPSSAKCLLLWVMSQNVKLFRVQQNTSSLDSERNLELQPFMKVLYHEARPNSEAARSWVHQFTVDHYYISDTMMQDIIKLLGQTSGCVLQCPEISPSFSIGYLPVKM